MNKAAEKNVVVEKTITAQKTSDGAGVTLYRSLGTHQLPTVDPFLMLDEFKSDNPNDYIAGFPSHPHRGFETVTYMLEGKVEHQDHKGNKGVIKSGGVQWMTAGRGIIHSEMPIQENGLMWGFQLWVNLPSYQKMKEASYQNIEPEQVSEINLESGSLVRIIAGNTMGIEGAAKGIDTDPLFIDVRLVPADSFSQPIEPTHNSLIYVYRGMIHVGDTKEAKLETVSQGQLAVLSKGTNLSVKAENKDTGFILLSGKPIGEPVAKYGPFVMNTEAEIQQAIEDYQSGNLAK